MRRYGSRSRTRRVLSAETGCGVRNRRPVRGIRSAGCGITRPTIRAKSCCVSTTRQVVPLLVGLGRGAERRCVSGRSVPRSEKPLLRGADPPGGEHTEKTRYLFPRVGFSAKAKPDSRNLVRAAVAMFITPNAPHRQGSQLLPACRWRTNQPCRL